MFTEDDTGGPLEERDTMMPCLSTMVQLATLMDTLAFFTACGVHGGDAPVEPKLLRPRESHPPGAARTPVYPYAVPNTSSSGQCEFRVAGSVCSPNSTGEESSGQLPGARDWGVNLTFKVVQDTNCL